MSRARNIKPGFFKNDRLAECKPLARILFAGLWCEADREGRLEDRPKRLKAEYLGYDNCDCDALLQELHTAGFIVRYSVAENRYISIVNFTKHQNPHVKEGASTIPAPCEPGASTVLSPVQASEIPERARLIPDSPSLIPESKNSCATDVAPLSLVSESGPKHKSRFEEFWSVYPNKKGKSEAESKWQRMKFDAIADRIIADVMERKKRDRDWIRGFVPHGSTYVNGKGWEDDIPEPTARDLAAEDAPVSATDTNFHIRTAV